MVKAGKRTYFFDVKQAKSGEKYLVITESKLVGPGYGRQRSTVMVFADAIADFLAQLEAVAKTI